jgi:CRP-like cAMP-binding protein
MLEGFFANKKETGHPPLSAEDCFNQLSEKEKQELSDHTIEIEFEAGETIIKRGFAASNILYLEKGLAKLDILNDGQTSTVGLISPKSFVGIVCTFASKNLEFSAIALEKTTISLISIEVFEKFIKQNGEFACHIIRHMSGITNQVIHHISRFSHKNIEGALSILLLDFANIYQSDSFTLPINRKEMANMLGYSKESVINTLSKFNKEGLLEVHEKKIKLIQREKLKKISELG